MRFLVLSLLFVCTLSAANQNRLQFEPAYPVALNPIGTALLVGTVYSSQPGAQVTLTLLDPWMEFASSPSGCPSGSGSLTKTVTAPAAIYLCVLNTNPGSDPLTPQITATASGFPTAYDYLPISLGQTHTVTASPSIIDLSQGQQTVSLAVSSGDSPTNLNPIYLPSGSNSWLNLSGACSLSGSWTAGSCTATVNSSGLTAGQQYAALVTFNTAFGDSATLVVTYTYPGTSLAITSGFYLPFGQFQTVNTMLGATSGTLPYRWSATGLPPGLSISSNGVISGTVDFPNTWTPQITVQDAAGHSATEIVTVAPSSISFTSQVGVPNGNSPIFVGYLNGPPPGVRVTITPLFSAPPKGSTTPVLFVLSGSASCPANAPSSPTSVTVTTPTPIYACVYGSLPVGTSNYSFTATAPGFAPTTWTFQIGVQGQGFWLLATPPGPVEVSQQSVPFTASIQNGGGTTGSPPHVASVCVQYSPNGACVASSSSGQSGNWVTTSMQSTCATSTSCMITVGANWSGQIPPTPGMTYFAGVRVADNQGDAASVVVTYTSAPAQPVPLRFIPIAPCRVVDTRNASDAFSGAALTAQMERDYVIPSSPNIGNSQNCPGVSSIPSSAAAYALNVTVVPMGPVPFVTVWPTGQSQPNTSILNSYDGRIKSNAAIVPASATGGVSVYATGNTNLAIDVTGYFVPASNNSALAFYPLAPCRVVDTRPNSGYEGAGSYLHGSAQGVNFAVSGACNVPTSAQAYSLNFTAVPKKGTLTYLTAWPSGQTQPGASTLNAPTGTITANAAITPAGTSGEISAYASDDTELIIDINGYFAPPTTGLSLYTLTPCRVLDTRSGSPFNGTLIVPIATSTSCSVPSAAQAYVFNATVAPPGPLIYLTLWPDGQGSAPTASTLNASDGSVSSNLALVPVTNGSIDAYASNPTYLLLDIFGYFAP